METDQREWINHSCPFRWQDLRPHPSNDVALFFMRINVYIDGFNFYHGALEGTRYQWINLRTLGQLLVPDGTIEEVHFFTARVKSYRGSPGSSQRQDTYIRAIQTLERTFVHEGTFLSLPGGRTTEKGSDVNLATQLLLDCFDQKIDKALIISADSDFATPIKVAIDRFDIEVVSAFPLGRNSTKLRQVSAAVVQIREQNLRGAMFDRTLITADGKTISCPPSWVGGPRKPPSYKEFLRRPTNARKKKCA